MTYGAPVLDGPPLRLPDPCLVVLVGATAAGKSDWAARWFHPDQVVSSVRLRAVVGSGERDVRASRDAFEVLDLIDGAVYTSEIPWTKPHPEAFRAAMKTIGVTDPAECVFVGDRPYDDVHGAKSAGMRAVGNE